MIDLDDTSLCPTGPECASCGETRSLGPAVVRGERAPYCVTICVWCAQLGATPPLTGAAENAAVLDHCIEHCGLEPPDLDAALLATTTSL